MGDTKPNNGDFRRRIERALERRLDIPPDDDLPELENAAKQDLPPEVYRKTIERVRSQIRAYKRAKFPLYQAIRLADITLTPTSLLRYELPISKRLIPALETARAIGYAALVYACTR